jgi:ATP-dependent helicase YprA (DUF1998 family)
MKTYYVRDSTFQEKEIDLRQGLLELFQRLKDLIPVLIGPTLSQQDWTRIHTEVILATNSLRNAEPRLRRFSDLQEIEIVQTSANKCGCGSEEFNETGTFRICLLPLPSKMPQLAIPIPVYKCAKCGKCNEVPQGVIRFDHDLIKSLQKALKGRGRNTREYMVEKVAKHPGWGAAKLRDKYQAELKSAYTSYREKTSDEIRRSFQHYIDKHR